jgi:hypothetical protein
MPAPEVSRKFRLDVVHVASDIFWGIIAIARGEANEKTIVWRAAIWADDDASEANSNNKATRSVYIPRSAHSCTKLVASREDGP